jgi:hypothetical protein
MAFECVHCNTVIEDEALKVPRSGAVCPSCKKDPTEGWSPYMPEVAEEGRKVAEEMNLRMLIHDYGVQEAALWFLEDLMLEKRHELSIRLGRNYVSAGKCSVCAAEVPEGEGFRIELADKWRSTRIILSLCEKHLNEGLWGRELDLHANHPDPWLTRGDWHYANEGKPKVQPP